MKKIISFIIAIILTFLVFIIGGVIESEENNLEVYETQNNDELQENSVNHGIESVINNTVIDYSNVEENENLKQEVIDEIVVDTEATEEIDKTKVSLDKFNFDNAFYHTTKRSKSFYIFDSSSNKVIYITHSGTTNTYKEGTYSGNLYSEFDVSIAYGKSGEITTTHYKRNGSKIETYFSDGSVNSSYSYCSVDDAKQYLLKTDYFN